MRALVLLAVISIGCSSAPTKSYDQPETSTSTIDAGLPCCQIVTNNVDDPMWNNRTYTCNGNPSWVCNGNMSCDDPGCQVGMPCSSFNGAKSLVVQCP